MLNHKLNNLGGSVKEFMPVIAPDLKQICLLSDADRDEVLRFLNVRPVHTVVMASFIHDNGVESDLNRGEFYGYRNERGMLEGVALIGHTTLIEARSDAAMAAFAYTARANRTPIHLVMSEHENALTFWRHFSDGSQPRLTCTELLFETRFPMLVRDCEWDVRPASMDEIEQVAAAQAEVAFIESGVDPMLRDKKGFMERVARRIQTGRCFVVFDKGRLVFKADVIAEAGGIAYIEGVYVHPDLRGQGVGSRCLSKFNLILLERVETVCMLSNERFIGAHKSFRMAGFHEVGRCTTLFT